MALSKSLFILSTFISLLTNFLNLSLFTSIPLTILLSFLPISALFKSNFALESDWRLRFFNSRFNASRFSSKVRIEFEISVIRDSKLADLISWEILVIRVDFSEMSSWRFVRSWERVRFEASSDSVWEMDCWRDFYFFVISLFSIFFWLWLNGEKCLQFGFECFVFSLPRVGVPYADLLPYPWTRCF